MSSNDITLRLRPRGKPIPSLQDELSVPPSASTSSLYTLLSTQTHLSPSRLRITKGSDGTYLPSSSSTTISSTGLLDQSTITIKDLGPQIAWKTVFVVEYLGPLLIHPIIYALRRKIYSSAPEEASSLQTLTMALIVAHFIKREAETLFVHRFSAATMPARNIFKNSAHYWLLAGLNVAGWIYAPSSPTAKPANALFLYPGLLAYTLGELGNLNAHLVLRNLRTAGTKERGIPHGFGFSWVTCPNYLFEVLAWIGVWLVSGGSLSVVVFAGVSTAQMMAWAGKKEKNYRREFGDRYKKKRYAMIPGIW